MLRECGRLSQCTFSLAEVQRGGSLTLGRRITYATSLTYASREICRWPELLVSNFGVIFFLSFLELLEEISAVNTTPNSACYVRATILFKAAESCVAVLLPKENDQVRQGL